MPRLQVGTVIRYVGISMPHLAGMQGYVTGFGPSGTEIRLSPFAETDTHVVDAADLRPLRKFTKSFDKKYPTPAFEHLPGAK
jgi:hypothetical protein